MNPGGTVGVLILKVIYNVNYEAMRKTRVFAGIVAAAAAISPKAEEFAAEGLRYSVGDYTHATVIGCEDPDAEVIFIPYTVNHKAEDGREYMFFVTEIAPRALADSHMTTLILAPPPSEGAASQGNLTINDGAFATPSLRNVNTYRPELPAVNGEPFSDATYADGTLGFGINLTADEIELYKTTEPWSRFNRTEVTSASSVGPDNGQPGDVELYTLSGIKAYHGPASSAPSGLYVIRRGGTASVTRL